MSGALGVRRMVVAQQLEHTDARLVLQRYGHLYPGAAAQAALTGFASKFVLRCH